MESDTKTQIKQQKPCGNIEPGLLSLNLDVEHVADFDISGDIKLFLKTKLDTEHNMVHDIVNSLTDLLDFQQPQKQTDALARMENRHQENKHHLNTIADLENLYRKLNRSEESEKMRKIKEDILTKEEYRTERAICLLEQGYAVSLDISFTECNKRKHGLKGCLESLENGIDHADHVEKLKDVSSSSTDENEKTNETIKKIDVSIEKLRQGLAELKTTSYDEFLKLVWEYFLANEYSRSAASLRKTTGSESRDETVISLNLDAFSIYWQIIQQHNSTAVPSACRSYVARSYSRVGYILAVEREKWYIKRGNILKWFANDEHFQNLLKYPDHSFQLAYELDENDIYVLNSLNYNILHSNQRNITPNERFKNLKKAHDLASKSIHIQKFYNDFAFEVRMRINHGLGCIEYANTENIKQYLEAGRKDGLECCKSGSTYSFLMTLAMICQKLAKFPNCSKHGPNYVKDLQCLSDALTCLNTFLQRGDIKYFFCHTFSSCLFEARKYRPSIEWMKRAMYLSYKPSLVSLRHICIYILQLYSEVAKEDRNRSESLLAEMFFVIKEIRSKENFEDKTWIEEFKKLYYRMKREYTDYLKFLIKRLEYPCVRQQAALIAPSVLNDSSKRLDYSEVQKLRQMDSSGVAERPEIAWPIGDFNPLKWRQTEPIQVLLSKHENKYDFFVSHSDYDCGWIHNFLLPQLEYKLHDTDTPFKGCVHMRDFDPVKTKVENIVFAVENSYKIFLVITPNFIQDDWIYFESDKVLKETFMIRKERKDIILVWLSECEIPTTLEELDIIDLRATSEPNLNIFKLKEVLL